MNELLSSGSLVDVALVALAVEALALVAWRRRTRRGLRPIDVMGHLAAGAVLLLAVRNEVVGGDRLVTIALLAASFPVHLFDLVRRARQASRLDADANTNATSRAGSGPGA